MDGLGPWWRNLSEQEQLAQILENCSLWVFDPETAKVFENAIERLFYSESFRIRKGRAAPAARPLPAPPAGRHDPAYRGRKLHATWSAM